MKLVCPIYVVWWVADSRDCAVVTVDKRESEIMTPSLRQVRAAKQAEYHSKMISWYFCYQNKDRTHFVTYLLRTLPVSYLSLATYLLFCFLLNYYEFTFCFSVAVLFPCFSPVSQTLHFETLYSSMNTDVWQTQGSLSIHNPLTTQGFSYR